LSGLDPLSERVKNIVKLFGFRYWHDRRPFLPQLSGVQGRGRKVQKGDRGKNRKCQGARETLLSVSGWLFRLPLLSPFLFEKFFGKSLYYKLVH